MKTLFNFILLLAVITACSKSSNGQQIWDSVGTGLNGYYINPGFTSSDGSRVSSLCVFNGELYAGGTFLQAGNDTVYAIAVWNGTSWNPVGGGIKARGPSAGVDAMIVYNNELYVAGYIDTIGSMPVNEIARWDGAKWDSVGGGISYPTNLGDEGGITCMAIYDGDLYVGGSFDRAGNDTGSGLAKWDGSNWSGIPGIDQGNGVSSLCVYNGELYIGGWSTTEISGLPQHEYIYRWNGATWDTVGIGFASSWPIVPNGVQSLCVYDSTLYAAGYLYANGTDTVTNIARWDGNTWSKVGNGVPIIAQVFAMTVYNGLLYVGGALNGGFDSAGTGNRLDYHILTWDGASWDTAGNELTVGNDAAQIYAFCTYNGQLYAGGVIELDFSSDTSFNIAVLSQTASGIKQTKADNCTTIFPNPTRDYVTISLNENDEIKSIKIMNDIGEVISSQTLNHSYAGNITVELPGPGGLYFIKLEGENEEYIGKVIKE